jgi:hypothetical protein
MLQKLLDIIRIVHLAPELGQFFFFYSRGDVEAGGYDVPFLVLNYYPHIVIVYGCNSTADLSIIGSLS